MNVRYTYTFAKKLRKAAVSLFMFVRDTKQMNFRENPNLGFLLTLIHIFQFGVKIGQKLHRFHMVTYEHLRACSS
jgi:hypothetical protein